MKNYDHAHTIMKSTAAGGYEWCRLLAVEGTSRFVHYHSKLSGHGDWWVIHQQVDIAPRCIPIESMVCSECPETLTPKAPAAPPLGIERWS